MFHLSLICLSLDSSYPGSRFKDEVTDYYYAGEQSRAQKHSVPGARSSLHHHSQAYDDQPSPTYARQRKGL